MFLIAPHHGARRVTEAERLNITTRLNQAETAYHELMTGRQPRVLVDQNGERVEYNPSNAFRLAAYIADLKRQLGLISVGPMRVWLT
jgi:hypothetical protein